jgi:hypothetical protein
MLKNWYDGYLTCEDNLNMCSTASKNETFFEMFMDFKRAKTKEDFTPPNYFCKFEVPLDKDIAW